MKVLLTVFVICYLALLAGCGNVSTPYIMDTDRVDQSMNIGNRGYLKGTPPPAGDRSALKRKLIAIDVDLPEGAQKESGPTEAGRVVEKRREVTVTREETPTTVKEKIVVRAEEIK